MAQPAWKLEPEEPAEDARDSLLDALRELAESMSQLEEAVAREQQLGEERQRQLATLAVQTEEERRKDTEVRAKVADQLLRTAECIEGLLRVGADEAVSDEGGEADGDEAPYANGNGGYGEGDEDGDAALVEAEMSEAMEADGAAAGEEARP